MFDELKEEIQTELDIIRKENSNGNPSNLLIAECCVDIERLLDSMTLSSMDIVEVALLRRHCQTEIVKKTAKGETNSDNIGVLFDALMGPSEEEGK